MDLTRRGLFAAIAGTLAVRMLPKIKSPSEPRPMPVIRTGGVVCYYPKHLLHMESI